MFKREDLKFEVFYTWIENTNIENISIDITEIFDKNDGWQVLNLINLFANKHELIQISSCHKIEVSICLCEIEQMNLEQMMDYLEKDLELLISTLKISKK